MIEGSNNAEVDAIDSDIALLQKQITRTQQGQQHPASRGDSSCLAATDAFRAFLFVAQICAPKRSTSQIFLRVHGTSVSGDVASLQFRQPLGTEICRFDWRNGLSLGSWRGSMQMPNQCRPKIPFASGASSHPIPCSSAPAATKILRRSREEGSYVRHHYLRDATTVVAVGFIDVLFSRYRAVSVGCLLIFCCRSSCSHGRRKLGVRSSTTGREKVTI